MDDLLKKQTNVEDSVVLELAGDIDLNCSNLMREILMDAFGSKPEAVILDLSAVTFMDSSGLATLVEALQTSRKEKISLKLVGLQSQVKSLFEIARLEQLFDLFDSQEEALK